MIAAGNRREPICEIELELKSGTPGCLFDLALEIAAALPVGLNNRSKAERGYALAANSKPAPVKAAPAAITAQMTVEEAFVALVSQCLAHRGERRRPLRGRDPEYCTSPSGVRRCVRYWCSGCWPGAVVHCWKLKALGQTLGAARDGTVRQRDADAFGARGCDHPGIAELRTREQRRRRTGQAERNAVAGRRIPNVVAFRRLNEGAGAAMHTRGPRCRSRPQPALAGRFRWYKNAGAGRGWRFRICTVTHAANG